jgi:hypothetical protein
MLKLVKNSFSLSDKKSSFSSKVKNSTEDEVCESSELSDQQHVISTLESLLQKAKDGDISGLMYVVATEGEDHGVGVAGEYLSNTHTGLAAFCLVYHLLGDEMKKNSPLCW